MALTTFKCNCLISLHFKGLSVLWNDFSDRSLDLFQTIFSRTCTVALDWWRLGVDPDTD